MKAMIMKKNKILLPKPIKEYNKDILETKFNELK